jgi:hypothetical protein
MLTFDASSPVTCHLTILTVGVAAFLAWLVAVKLAIVIVPDSAAEDWK